MADEGAFGKSCGMAKSPNMEVKKLNTPAMIRMIGQTRWNGIQSGKNECERAKSLENHIEGTQRASDQRSWQISEVPKRVVGEHLASNLGECNATRV